MKNSFEGYRMIKTVCRIDDIEFESYGIANANIAFPDVSTDRETVEEMIERINREELEECHLRFFIEDELDK